MPPNAKTLARLLNDARSGLNKAQRAVDEWSEGQVAKVAHTNAQRAALRVDFEAGLQAAKDRITEVDAELSE